MLPPELEEYIKALFADTDRWLESGNEALATNSPELNHRDVLEHKLLQDFAHEVRELVVEAMTRAYWCGRKDAHEEEFLLH